MYQSWGSTLTFIPYFWKYSLEGTVTWIQPKEQQNWRYLNYWQSYWAEKGTKMSGLIPSNWFLTFLARPCCFRALRNKKHRKFRCFLRFLAIFLIFLFLGALKQHGCTRNIKNQSEGISPDILIPFSAQ